MKLCLSIKKTPLMSVSALSEEELTFFSSADLISLLSTAVCFFFLAEQLVYEATKYLQIESYSVSFIHPTDLWRCKKTFTIKPSKYIFTCNLVAFSCVLLSRFTDICCQMSY